MIAEETKVLEFRLLGPLEVVSNGTPLALGGPHQRALLALLLLHANEVVSRDRLIDSLWGERAPATAANALQVMVHGVRKLVGPERIVTHGTGYRLRIDAGELDLERASKLVEEASGRDPAASAEALSSALALWRGPALVDVGDAPFARAESGRLEEFRLAASEQWIEAELALGRHAEVVGQLEALIALHPFRERLRAQLMVALYRSGRQAEALAAYQQTRSTLVEEHGIEPGQELQDLERSILRHDPSLVLPPTSAPATTNLPTPATGLVGRELELAAVTALLRRADVRLLTLTGPGGTGKTRVAVAAASELSRDFAEGVVFVDLAPLEDPALVASTIAHALGVGEGSLPTVEHLKEALREREALLLLDNFERVDDAAPLVAELVAAAPRLKVLTTSRAVLHLSGEHEYPVPPLRTPDTEQALGLGTLEQNEAVALFIARARAAQHDFRLSGENAQAVAGICVALDGLPLALELAAARIKLFSPAGLLERLEQSLDLLTGGPRDLPDRHQTLRAAIDWSYDLLDPAERDLFAPLGVFAGGFTSDAAAAVCGASLEMLAAFADKSLLGRQAKDTGASRFGLLETIRAYALERLEASPRAEEVPRRHAAYFLTLAEEAGTALWGPVQGPERAEWLDRLEVEHDNLRTALAWGARHDPELELRLAVALVDFWADRSYLEEGRAWLEQALQRADRAPAPLRAKALHSASYLAFGQGDLLRAEDLGEQGLELYRELGDKEGAGRTVHVLGWAAAQRGDLGRAVALAEESLALARELGHTRGIIVSLSNVGLLTARQSNRERAAALLAEGLSLAREHGDRTGVAYILLNWGELATEHGDYEAARDMLAESLGLYREQGTTAAVASCVQKLGLLAEARAQPKRAVRLLAAAERLRESLSSSLLPVDQPAHDRAVSRARGALGEEAFATTWADGRALALDAAVSFALETPTADWGPEQG